MAKCLKSELMVLRSNYQLCLCQKCSIKYAIETPRKQHEKKYSDAKLLIAFYSLNRNLALRNIANICSSILLAIQKSYPKLSKLFVNKKVVLSREGTTQRDPLPMAMYGLATFSYIKIEMVCKRWERSRKFEEPAKIS